MRETVLGLLMLLAAVAPGHAASYTVTLTSEQDETLTEQVGIVNALKGKKGTDVAPAALLQRAVDQIIERWERDHAQTGASVPGAKKTPRQRRLACKQAQLDPCPR